MNATQRETEIFVDPKVPLVRITREFDAPPAKVFRAHADPALMAQWTGPRSVKIEIERYDCRTGGAYRYAATSEGEQYWFYGSFHEVRPNELIIQTFTFEGQPDAVALEKLELVELGNDRTRLIATSLTDSFEGRDAFVASGMDVGVREGYEKLDELLARS